jgi:hypothetical protein
VAASAWQNGPSLTRQSSPPASPVRRSDDKHRAEHEGDLPGKIELVLWTGSDEQARAAEADGLTVYQSDLTAAAAAALPSDLDGLDFALAVGDNNALNAMIATDLSEFFPRDHVFQLPSAMTCTRPSE